MFKSCLLHFHFNKFPNGIWVAQDYHDDMKIQNFSLQIAIIFFKFDTNIPFFSSLYKFVGNNTIIFTSAMEIPSYSKIGLGAQGTILENIPIYLLLVNNRLSSRFVNVFGSVFIKKTVSDGYSLLPRVDFKFVFFRYHTYWFKFAQVTGW